MIKRIMRRIFALGLAIAALWLYLDRDQLYLAAAGASVLLVCWIVYRLMCPREPWLPQDLKAGRLKLVETDLYERIRFRIAGRPDRVYETKQGLMCPAEFKTRDTFMVFPTDKAQLSLQGWLLRQNGYETASHGYLIVRNRKSKKTQAIKVMLKDDDFCIALINRHRLLKAGQLEPRKANGPQCNTCSFDKKCFA